MKETKILIIQRIFSNYRQPIFDRLNNNHELLLLHGKNKRGIKQINTEYSKQVKQVQYYKKETNVYLNVFFDLFKFKPQIVVHEFNPSIISLYPLLILKYL